MEISSSFVQSGQGKTLLSIFRDVTERKSAEQRLAAFSILGQKLSAATTAREAGEIIVAVADQLLGWDACTLDFIRRRRTGSIRAEPGHDQRPAGGLSRRMARRAASCRAHARPLRLADS